MTTTATMSTKGFAEYLERIAEIGRDLDAAAADAVYAGAEVLQASMQGLVPVKTGNLRDHIKIKGPEQDGNYVFCEVGVIHDRAFTDADTARYGNAVEYGTTKMAAQPYIRPGIDMGRSKARRAMRDSLEQAGML